MKAVILIPTYNERENISHLLPKIRAVAGKIKKWKVDILVVDDNSPDKTADVVRKIATRRKNVHLLLRPKKTGLGAAYLAGMAKAFKNLHADVVLVMDADLSHNPSHIPNFLKKIEEGCDFVVGSRYTNGGSIAKSWAPHRKLLSILGNQIVPLMLGRRALTDWTSGYRAIRKRVFGKVYPLISDKKTMLRGYTFNIAFAHYVVMSGFQVGQVPIKFADRTSGKSKLGLEYLFHTPIFLIHTRLKILRNGILKL